MKQEISKESSQNNTWGELSKDKQELMAMKATFKDMNLKLVEANKKIKSLENSKKNKKEDPIRSCATFPNEN